MSLNDEGRKPVTMVMATDTQEVTNTMKCSITSDTEREYFTCHNPYDWPVAENETGFK